jgi:hypothetical protein
MNGCSKLSTCKLFFSGRQLQICNDLFGLVLGALSQPGLPALCSPESLRHSFFSIPPFITYIYIYIHVYVYVYVCTHIDIHSHTYPPAAHTRQDEKGQKFIIELKTRYKEGLKQAPHRARSIHVHSSIIVESKHQRPHTYTRRTEFEALPARRRTRWRWC